jgi:hypothetical protein
LGSSFLIYIRRNTLPNLFYVKHFTVISRVIKYSPDAVVATEEYDSLPYTLWMER